MRVRDGEAGDQAAVERVVDEVYGLDDDYVARVYPAWLEAAREGDARVLLAEDDAGDVVGVMSAVLLTATEGWVQGIRVTPRARGLGAGSALTEAGFAWLAERGATAARNLVFSWNPPGLALSRRLRMRPVAALRWALVEPDADAEGGAMSRDADAAWRAWERSRACQLLEGLSLDPNETWAVSRLTLALLREMAGRDRLLVAGPPDAPAGTAGHVRTTEREEDGTSVAEARYGAACWRDPGACHELLRVVARDAAERGADRARVLVPEDAGIVSDVALAHGDVWRGSLYVFERALGR